MQTLELEYCEISFKRDNYKNRISLGSGTFGEAYVGKYRGQEVVVKELKREAIKKWSE